MVTGNGTLNNDSPRPVSSIWAYLRSSDSGGLSVVSTGAGVVEITDTSDVRLAPQPATDEGRGSGRLPMLKAPNDIHMPKARAVRNPAMAPWTTEQTLASVGLKVVPSSLKGRHRPRKDVPAPSWVFRPPLPRWW